MSDIAIRAENLSKRYAISRAKMRHDTLSEKLVDNLKSVFHRKEGLHLGKEMFWALKDVSFELKQGEIVGIIGQNGAGKSTLLKIITQITMPTYGQAQLYGRVGSLLEVGTGFHPELTGRENIYLNGAIIGMKKEEIRKRFDDIVDFAEIGAFLDVPVKRYSSGMYVRLGFSVAVHLEPEILLVDEVLSVGDAAFQKKCLDKISDTAKKGGTVLFISHNMAAVNTLCQRVIWLKSGRIVEDGSSADIVTRYLAKSVSSGDLTEEVWDDMNEAPGNDRVRLHRVRVRRQDDRESDPLTMQTPFRVEVDYWNMEADARLHIALFLYTAEGIIAFATGRPNNQPMPAGKLRSTCHVTGNLLNEGPHRIVVFVVKDSSCIIYSHESQVTINIIDVREREGSWFGKSPGVVQPELEWKTETLEGSHLFEEPVRENLQAYG